MKSIIKEIREYIACPQFGDDHYGKWGALGISQRTKIKELCDYANALEGMVDEYNKLNDDAIDATEYFSKFVLGIWNNDNEDYKVRFVKEYKELKERYGKLHKMIVKAEAGTLDFEPDCPLDLLKQQAKAMGEYLHILEIRAEIERIDINE